MPEKRRREDDGYPLLDFEEGYLEDDLDRAALDIDGILTQRDEFAKSKRTKILRKMTQINNHTVPYADSASNNNAVAGIIKKVMLKNFMCHENFELDFGPRLNFIIGHNGSGKSAILTGISVCLGAKAGDTNRGSSLRDLIKEGKHFSTVTVILANEGEDAYEPEKFGREIILERHLKRDNTNFPYVLKSETGARVSTKKADLDAILDFFGIAVNNPMAFLSQDQARSFLTASSDEQKYKYFMKGTLMDEILQNFKSTEEKVEKINVKLLRMKDDMRRLKSDAKEAQKLHQALLSSNDLRQRERILHGKYFWMEADKQQDLINEVNDARVEMLNAINDIEKYIGELQQKIDNFHTHKNSLIEKKAALQEELEFAKKSKADKFNEVKAAEAARRSIEDQLNDSEKNIKKLESRVHELDKNIRFEEDKLKEQSGGSKEILSTQLSQLEHEHHALNSRVSEVNDELEKVDGEYRGVYEGMQREVDEKHSEIRNLRNQIQLLQSKEVNELGAYSPNVKGVVKEIQRSKFKSDIIGPLGLYFSVKPEYEKYKNLVEAHIGFHLSAFLVDNLSDQRQLQRVIKAQNARSQILIRKDEKFDYGSGLPDSAFLCLVDILEFKDERVKYALIDLAHIEKVILTEDRKEAQLIIERKEYNVGVALSLLNQTSGQRSSMNSNGGFKVDPLYYDTTSLSKLRCGDKAVDIAGLERNLGIDIEELRVLEHEQTDYSNKIRQLKATYNANIRELKSQIHMTTSQVNSIRTKLEDEVDTGRLEALKEEKIEIKSSFVAYENTIRDSLGDMEKQKSLIHKLRQEFKILTAEYASILQNADALDTKIVNYDGERELQLSKLQHFEKKKKEREDEISGLIANLPAWQKSAEEFANRAQESCTREEADSIHLSSLESVKNEIEKVADQVDKANRDLGKDPEEIVSYAKVARAKFKEACELFNDAVNNKKNLQDSLHERLKAFRTSREASCIEADLDFKNSLQFRNFSGSLDFNFSKEKLTMYVSTKNDKKPRHVDSLSGGEKSFSQISLLLATWKPMRSRIRGLDEFDVFMDQVNRKIGMRLMLSKLSCEMNTQTIFITPQDIGQIADLDEAVVRIHRIRDPRGGRV